MSCFLSVENAAPMTTHDYVACLLSRDGIQNAEEMLVISVQNMSRKWYDDMKWKVSNKRSHRLNFLE